MEIRFCGEIRHSEGREVHGYAALWNVPAKIANFTETVLPGAFRASLNASTDILALLDHKPDRLLGRTSSGTLQLAEDQKGLRFTLQIPNTSAGQDVLELIQRNDLGGASFGFLVRPKGEQWEGRSRKLSDLDLREISLVSSWPAYSETGKEIQLRSMPNRNKRFYYMESIR
jgi:uncharacterized protein